MSSSRGARGLWPRGGGGWGATCARTWFQEGLRGPSRTGALNAGVPRLLRVVHIVFHIQDDGGRHAARGPVLILKSTDARK